MSTKINLKPVRKVIDELGLKSNGRVQKFLTNTCYRHMDKYVPMDEGNLRIVVNIGSDYVEYEMPYAHYQYVGHWEDGSHQIRRHTTKGTTTYWDQKMWQVEKNNVINEVINFIERG